MLSGFYRRKESDTVISAGLFAVILFFVAATFISYWNTERIKANTLQVTRTHETIASLAAITSLMKDAETGQRGFLLTGEEAYLEPYIKAMGALEQQLIKTQSLLDDNPSQLEKINLIKKHIEAKLIELTQTIELRRTQGFDAALSVVLSNRGKSEMDAVRDLIEEVRQNETAIRMQRLEEMQQAFRIAITSGVLTGIIGILLSAAVGYLASRASNNQKKQDWLSTGQVGLSAATFGEMQISQLGDNILTFLAEYLGAPAGAFYVKENGTFNRVATYGVPENSNTPTEFKTGDSLLGQAVKDNKPFTISNVPDGYLYFGSGFGQSKPRSLVIFPITAENSVNAVLELGFLHEMDSMTIELLQKVSEVIGVAVRSVAYRSSLQNLLEETQRQSEELQTQSEELKVSNEELEEQSRVLKESQVRLEQQQVEMEQTNSQLEEQTQMLEAQRDDLERSKSLVQQKAYELEQASQYKSNFLANMSHELRTPLNSSLILAKLLADNPGGNLSDEQVRYAHTIQSAGNDLLTLINDILDLSKIEAGHMEIRPENVTMSRLAGDLRRMFEPIAKDKGLTFKTIVSGDCPESFTSDRLRLEQVIKNLISNALKFTEKGSVEVAVNCNAEAITFAVKDTGIGISQDQQDAIFDAFRQADGTISRKYGGTGLGLSISRELARLLGGRIELQSKIGKGSTFTLTIPKEYSAAAIMPALKPVMPLVTDIAPEQAQEPPAIVRYKGIADDRDKLVDNKRVILAIEDDESFARILYDLAHEMHFQCLIATSAEEGLVVAKQYLPNAVLLDVGLPDNSGLSVLDRLKRDARTRHIPVHVISANDYSQTALSLGAVGYMLKPVKREELAEAFKSIEERFAQRMRRVLIVEDDKVQRESVKKLLGSYDVETVAVGTAAECLERLKGGTFDCMVLDLSLPDASGYSLLETLSNEDTYSFPPVIVYTGRDLSSDEEHRLRRYSKSIIIKGAKSPERLLDEVTLFLHQVVSDLPPEQQRMLEKAKSRDDILKDKHILVVEDDVRNVYAVTSILEPQGAKVFIARNGREALDMLEKSKSDPAKAIDLVLMDVMMPEMDGLEATRAIRKQSEFKKLPILMLTAKAMKDDQERCLDAGANDYMAKPLDVEKLLSLIRVWLPR